MARPLGSLLVALAAFAARPALACEEVDPEALVTEAFRAVDEGRVADALLELEAGFQRFPASCTPVSAAALGRVAHVAGALALDSADREAAERWLTLAAMMAGGEAPPSGLGPEAAALYAEVRARIEGLGTGTVVATTPLWLDGARLETGDRREVATGTHLMQVELGGETSGRWLQVDGGMTSTIPEDRPVAPAVPGIQRPRWPVGVGLVVGGVALAGAGVGAHAAVSFGEAWTACEHGEVPGFQPVERARARDLGRCDQAQGSHVLLGTVGAVALGAAGGAAVAVGAGVVVLDLLPSGVWIRGRF